MVGHQQLRDEDGSGPSTVGSKLRSTLASSAFKGKNRGARAAGGSSEDWVSLASGKNDLWRKIADSRDALLSVRCNHG